MIALGGGFTQQSAGGALVAVTPITLITVATNVNGLQLLAASFFVEPAALTNLAAGFFLSKTGAYTGSYFCGIDSVAAIAANIWFSGSIKEHIYIPPGWGLFFSSSVASAAGANSQSVSYNIL